MEGEQPGQRGLLLQHQAAWERSSSRQVSAARPSAVACRQVSVAEGRGVGCRLSEWFLHSFTVRVVSSLLYRLGPCALCFIGFHLDEVIRCVQLPLSQVGKLR